MNVYQRSLEEVARQLQVIGTDRMFSDPIAIRELDWDDVVKVGGVTLRYDLNQVRENQEGTNERDIYGYPCFLVIAHGWRLQLADEVPSVGDFLQKVRAYFHNRRRMGQVIEPGATQLPSTVTAGPQTPERYHDAKIITRTIWAWFIESRATENYV